jgi:two-component system, response regulator YesN
MYKVLIADDEQPVIESISFMLQKYRPEIGIAGTAMSGREAIQAAEQTNPDIILIDVKMPGIDGLEALREIKRRKPNILPILTTAYERFDIAQTAFELGVQDYILKPFSRDKLIAAIDAAVESLDQRLDGRGDSLKHIELYHSLSSTIESLLFRAIKLNSDVSDFIPYLKETLNFKTTRGCVGILEWRKGAEDSMIDTGQAFISALKYKYPCLAMSFNHEVLFFFPEISDGHSIPDSGTIAGLIEEQFEDSFHWKYAAGECVDFENINDSYLNAQRTIGREAAALDINELLLYTKEWRSKLETALINLNMSAVKQIITDVLYDTADLYAAEAVLLDLLLYVEHVHSAATGFHLRVIRIPGDGRVQTAEELLIFFNSWAKALSEQLKTEQLENIPRVLSRALDFLNLNYSHPLQLSDVAEKVDVSAPYLSNLFTRHLRKSFVDQLTHIRVEKAKQLLKEQSYSIKEISAMVGYQDPNYFSRLFKKYTGSSPSEFG